MCMFLAHIEGLSQIIPVASLETVDHPRRNIDRSQQKCQRTGEVLAVPLFAVNEKVFHWIDTPILDIHLQCVGELA